MENNELKNAKMSDLETLKAMFSKSHISYDETVREGTSSDNIVTKVIDLTVFGGYQGFYTTFTFDDVGTLKDIGAYE